MSNNKRMTDPELSAKVENEIEWRKMMWRKLENIEISLSATKLTQAEMKTEVKIKSSFFGSASGFIFGMIATYITNVFLKH